MGVVSERLPEAAFERLYGTTCPAYRCAQRQGRMLRDGAEYDSWTAGSGDGDSLIARELVLSEP